MVVYLTSVSVSAEAARAAGVLQKGPRGLWGDSAESHPLKISGPNGDLMVI